MKTKTLIFIIIILQTLTSIAQFDYIDQRTLYKKFGIREIKVYFHDTTFSANEELLKIDTTGRIIYHELLADDTDSINSIKLWNYKKDLLTSYLNIGVWNTKTNKKDTTLTEYSYDLNKNLFKIQTTHTYNHDTLYNLYTYSNNGKLLGSKLYNEHQKWWFKKDTVEYSINGKPKLKTTISYANEHIEYKHDQYYDTTGTIQFEMFYDYNDKCYITNTTKTYLYSENKLVTIKEIHLGNSYLFKNVSHNETVFEYYPNGLLKQQTRLRNGKVLNSDTYEYE